MQFKVPQFLDIEDKIFGPFTFREFVYLAGGAGLSFVLYRLLGFYIGILPIFVVAGLSLALTFYKPNNKPFINMVEASLKYLLQDKLFIWKRSDIENEGSGAMVKSKALAEDKNKVNREDLARLSGSKLRDLAWSLDILDLNKHQNN